MKSALKKILPRELSGKLRPAWRSFRRWRIRTYQRAAGMVGLNLAKSRDYYSVLPVLESLYRSEKRWNRPSGLPGVRYDLEQLRANFDELISQHAAPVLPPEAYAEHSARGFGPGYPRVDAICSYAMIRKLKPARYIEIGSGLSTYFAWLAGQENAREGRPLAITCVEPYPSALLRSMQGVELIVDEVQNVSHERLARLGSGDVLFIDSTHALRVDSDVAYLFMEVVPRVPVGAYVHVHDIPFPYNIPYPADHWMLGDRWPVYWQEAMLLQAFLACNDSFDIVLSNPLVRHHDEAFIASRIPGYVPFAQDRNTYSSIWLHRTK